MTGSKPKTCEVALCDLPRVAGRQYCATHGPLKEALWTAPTPGTQLQPPGLSPGKSRDWTAVMVVAIIVIIVAAIGIGVFASKDKPSSGASSDTGSFVSKVAQNAKATAQDVGDLVVEVFAAVGAADDSLLYPISADATKLHNHLGDYRDDLLTAADIDNDDQAEMIDGENELKSGVGTIIRWCDDPSPSLTARWQSELEKGIAEWNASVTNLWDKAAAGDPPLITLPK